HHGLFGWLLHFGFGWRHWPHHGRAGRNGATHYRYDREHRLLSARGRTQGRFAYDPAGNLTRMSVGRHHTVLTPNALNQVAIKDTTSYQYDANGNLLDDGQRTYTWDAANRLISITDKTSGHVTTFRYDGFSRRVSVTETTSSGEVTTIHNLWYGLR